MIFKVQISRSSSDGIKHVLMYNKDRSIQDQSVASEEILLLMKDAPKKFFNAIVEDGTIKLLDVAHWQPW
jgi:hypothetical protein